MIVHHDYETRSKQLLKKVGHYRYAVCPSTEILLCAVSEDALDAPVYLWVNPLYWTEDMNGSENAAAEALLARADTLEGHNVPFEIAITWGALRRGAACPFKKMPDLAQYRDVAAVARKAGLPWGLESLCEALHLDEGKGKEGKQLIQLFSVPKKATKKHPGGFVAPQSRPDEWFAFGGYCRQDVRVEKKNKHKLKPFELSGAVLETFLFDLRMNHRGIPINLEAAAYAKQVIDRTERQVVQEFQALTGVNPSQRAQVKQWLASKGVKLPDMRATTLEEWLDEEEDREDWELVETGDHKEALAALQLYQKVGYAAAKKIDTMLKATCPDGFMRGSMVYYGAGTGRWSGKILQPHNFKKTPKDLRSAIDDIYRFVCERRSAEDIELIFGHPIEMIAATIRCFIHHPDFPILDGDFSAIEARIICWLAGETEVLEKWRRGEDLYKWMASHVYNIDISLVDDDQREVGKRIILGCGFQMGWKKFKSSCLTQYQLDLPDEICKKGVKLFRTLCQKIRAYWYYLQNQAKLAIGQPGHTHGPFTVRIIAGIPFLLFKLRSGRSLAYPHPKVEMEVYYEDEDADGNVYDEPQRRTRESITYWGQLKGNNWGRVKLYGGKLAENETQATAADFMAHGAIVAEKRGMAPFMLVHDQGLAAQTRQQTKEDFEAALGTLPSWAVGFPMKVEAKVLKFWKK